MAARPPALTTLLALAVLGASFGLRAEPAAPEHTTPEVRVERLAPAEIPEDPTAFTRVIEVEDYEGEGKGVADLLEATPGVNVRRFGGPGAPSEISIRGSSGSQVVVLLDGVRINSAQTGGVDLSSVPLALLERIEVSRGGGSAQTGSDAIGGVVNLITRRASARPETRVSGLAGSFQTWQGSLSQTGRLGDFEVLVGYDYFKTSGDWEFEPVGPDEVDTLERVNNRIEQQSGLLKLARDFGDRWRVELSDDLFHGSEGRPGLDEPQGGADRGQSRDGHQRRTRNVARLLLQGASLSPLGLDAELLAFHRFDRRRFEDQSSTPTADSDDRNGSYGGRARLAGELEWGPLQVVSSLAAELRRDELDRLETGFFARRVLGVFVQTELGLLENRLLLVPALRYDDTEDVGDEWIPRVGLRVRPARWLELRANAERSYRVPNYDELFLDEGSLRGSPALEPEDATNLDAGFRLEFAPVGPLPAVSFESVFFYNDIDNTIVFQQVSPQVVAATNIEDVRSRGVEVSGRVDLTAWLRVSGSWTHLDTEIGHDGNPLPGRPEDEYDLRAELTPFDGRVKLVAEMLYTGEIPVNEGGRSFLSDRTTFDASLGLDLHRFLSLGERLGLRSLLFSVAGTNLTDRAVRDSLSFPQPGRMLSFFLEARR